MIIDSCKNGPFCLVFFACILVPIHAEQIYLDSKFNNNSGIITFSNDASIVASSVSLQAADGKSVLAGTTNYLGTQSIFVRRYLTNGTIDTTFGTNGTTITNVGSSAFGLGSAIDSSGNIVVVGTSTSTQNDLTLVRYNSSGVLQGTTTTAIGSGAIGFACAIQPSDQKIVVGGYAIISGTPTLLVARYNTNGTIDTTFGSSGMTLTTVGSNSWACKIAIQSDNKIVIAGFTGTRTPYSEKFLLARYNTDGSLDSTFGTSGIVTTQIPGSIKDDAYGLAIEPVLGSPSSDNKIIVAGSSIINNLEQISLVRYSTNGTLDTTFGSSGVTNTSLGEYTTVTSTAIQSDGKIVIVGITDNKPFIARYTDDGILDTTFGIGGYLITTISGANNALFTSVAIQSNEKIIAAGSSDTNGLLVRYYKNNNDFIAITSPSTSSNVATNTLNAVGNASDSSCTVYLSIDSNSVGTATTDTYGNWSMQYPELANGSHTLTARLACVTSPLTILATTSNSVTVNSSTNSITINTPTENQIVTSSSTPTISGTASLAFATVSITIDAVVVGTTTTDILGRWSYTTAPLTTGNHSIIVELKSGSPLSTVASDLVSFSLNVPAKVVQGIITSTGTIVVGTGFSVSASGSTLTITFTPNFNSIPTLVATGQRSSGSSTVTVSNLTTSSASITFSTGTTRVNFVATQLPS